MSARDALGRIRLERLKLEFCLFHCNLFQALQICRNVRFVSLQVFKSDVSPVEMSVMFPCNLVQVFKSDVSPVEMSVRFPCNLVQVFKSDVSPVEMSVRFPCNLVQVFKSDVSPVSGKLTPSCGTSSPGSSSATTVSCWAGRLSSHLW